MAITPETKKRGKPPSGVDEDELVSQFSSVDLGITALFANDRSTSMLPVVMTRR